MDSVVSELRYAIRRLRRRPAFAAIAVGTLALGIGGATAIFSVADAVILRPLPFPQPDRLVAAWQRNVENDQAVVAISYKGYAEWRDQNRVFHALAAMGEGGQGWTLSGQGEPAQIAGRLVTGNFFAVMGVPAALGRTLVPDDDRIGATPVVVLSHASWSERFGRDPAIVGRSIVLDQRACTVVGVMPREFAYPHGAELWAPLVPGAGAETVESAGIQWMTAVGRLKAGTSVEGSQAEMTGVTVRYWRGVVEQLPANLKDVVHPEANAAVLTPLADVIHGPTRPALLALLGAVGLVLLIACANVAGLLLIRTTERSREMAVRLALGASRGRLALSLLAESLLLATLGGAAGLLAAGLAIPVLVRLSPQDVPRLQDAGLDARVFAFALVASLATALLSGLAPMLLVQSASLEPTLRAGSQRVAAGRSRFRSALVVSQVAVAVVLLSGAGLLGRSFLELRRAPLGYQPNHLLSVGAPWAPHPDAPGWRVFYQELLRRVQAVPGVDSAAAVSVRPLSGPTGWDFPFTIEGQTDADAQKNPSVNLEAVSADYFRTMGIAVRRGRVFTEADAEGRPGVVVIGESLARRGWPGQDPLGKRLKVPQWKSPYHDAWLEVVGVVADARYRDMTSTRLDLYMSHLQSDHRTGALMVRTRASPATVAPAVAEAVWSMDRNQARPKVITMTGVVWEALAIPRFATRVFGAFAFVAVGLAALGLYGLIAYSVTSRTREIGVRVALGARPGDVASLVVREGVGLALTGIALGLACAAAGTRYLGSLLYGVRATDAPTFAAVAAALLAVAVLACGLPLRRALAVDPAVALRHE
jgi:putative ABC transport system permease protein